MKKISVIILTMNEEEMIADCIRSVSWSDDIYILDNGSTDRTVEIALQNQVQVVVNKNSDFSVLRNFGLTLAKHDWVLFLDADERVTPHLKKEIANIPESSIYAGYNILRKNFFFGYAWPDAEILTRLINRKSDAKWQGRLHESIVVGGKLGNLCSPMIHIAHRTLEQMVQKTILWSQTEATLRLNAHHPTIQWWRLIRVYLTGFWHSYILKKGWSVGIPGLIESMYQGFSMVVTYVQLWEMQHNKKS